MDEEVAAMEAIRAALEPLDQMARMRLLRWAIERFSRPLRTRFNLLENALAQEAEERAKPS